MSVETIPVPAAATPLPGFPLVGGNDVTVYSRGAKAFDAMAEAIAGARDRIALEIYTFKNDGVGQRFAALLAERARAGVTVRILYDSVGCIEVPDSFFEDLRTAGATAIEFHPIAPWKPRWRSRLNRRDHRKILVVDGRIGFVGGLNFADEYADDGATPNRWRDTHARIAGPAAEVLERIFLDHWPEAPAAGETAPRPAGPWPSTPTLVRFFATGPSARQRIARQIFLRALAGATESLHLTFGYFMPERYVVRALRRAAERGVDVQLVLPRRTDAPVVRLAGHAVYGRLLRSGARIHERLEKTLHAKSVVVDARWTIIGSANLDSRSFFLNYEVGVEVFDARIGAEMEQAFAEDVARSEEIRPADWARRPAHMKLLARLCGVLRAFL